MNSFQELLLYRLYRTLTGDIAPVDVYRHNGKLAVRCLESEAPRMGVSDDVWAILSENLTPTEERRWWKLLGNPSIDDVASDERVSRSAIYVSIRGKDGHGGMIAKNPFVELWWLRRQLTAHK